MRGRHRGQGFPNWQSLQIRLVVLYKRCGHSDFLYTGQQGRLHRLAAIREHRIGRQHLVQRRFLRAERVGKYRDRLFRHPERSA